MSVTINTNPLDKNNEWVFVKYQLLSGEWRYYIDHSCGGWLANSSFICHKCGEQLPKRLQCVLKLMKAKT